MLCENGDEITRNSIFKEATYNNITDKFELLKYEENILMQSEFESLFQESIKDIDMTPGSIVNATVIDIKEDFIGNRKKREGFYNNSNLSNFDKRYNGKKIYDNILLFKEARRRLLNYYFPPFFLLHLVFSTNLGPETSCKLQMYCWCLRVSVAPHKPCS